MKEKIIKFGTQEYRFNYYIFISVPLILLFIAVVVMFKYDFDKGEHIYLKCPDDAITRCENPLFNTTFCFNRLGYNTALCNQEFLPVGFTFGIPPPTILKVFPNIAISLLLLGFVLNHWLFNKKWKWKQFFNTVNEKDNDEVIK
jgi:hypothetical protein